MWRNVLGDNAAAQEWVTRVTAERWFKTRFKPLRITVGVGRNNNGRSYGYGSITVSPSGRNAPVLLHEITHKALAAIARERGETYASHGPQFCALYLFLVEHVMGAEAADTLRDAYRRHRVRFFDTSGVVPRKPRFEVATQLEERQRRRRIEQSPPSPREVAAAADVIRRLVAQGGFGDSGRKPRIHVLDTARALERQRETLIAASRH